jgi:hypothetical protein
LPFESTASLEYRPVGIVAAHSLRWDAHKRVWQCCRFPTGLALLSLFAHTTIFRSSAPLSLAGWLCSTCSTCSSCCRLCPFHLTHLQDVSVISYILVPCLRHIFLVNGASFLVLVITIIHCALLLYYTLQFDDTETAHPLQTTLGSSLVAPKHSPQHVVPA